MALEARQREVIVDTDYNGTYSRVPMRKTDLSIGRVPKKRRSKGNRVEPRNSGPASECVSYMRDAEGNKVEGTGRMFYRPTKQRTMSKSEQLEQRADLINALDKRRKINASQLASNADVD